MHVTQFAAVLFSASLASTAATHRRADYADIIVQDIDNINDAVLANTAAVAAYDGGSVPTTFVDGAPVFATVAAIHVANRKAYVDALAAPQFDDSDTRRIFNEVVDTVAISLPNDIQVLIAKKPAFESSGLGPEVLASLELLLNDHDTLSQAIEAKTYKGDAVLTAEGETAAVEIHDAIQEGIDAYST